MWGVGWGGILSLASVKRQLVNFIRKGLIGKRNAETKRVRGRVDEFIIFLKSHT